jgi:signal-transduction protein with cAMP-binding, CBS, and nucleotidyltransferase domain
LCCQGSSLSIENNLTTIEKVIFLKSVDIFEHATVEQLGRIAGLTEEARFAAGQVIFKEGDPGDALYLILSGQVLIERNGITIREINERDAFGTSRSLISTLVPQPQKRPDRCTPSNSMAGNFMIF